MVPVVDSFQTPDHLRSKMPFVRALKTAPWISSTLSIGCLLMGASIAETPGDSAATVVDASPDNIELVRKIARSIASSTDDAFEDYAADIPLTATPYEMVAVEGGTFMMGSPEDEADRDDDEGPQVQVKVSPFWMGKFEVTWDQYEPFMVNGADRNKDGSPKDYDPATATDVDGVSQPTPPYTEMSFGMGQRGYPAICMTQHAANKFCQWLSAQTGHFYRLPTEAEWEFACRGGTQSAYSCDADDLAEHAWFYDNADGAYHRVGLKKPNPLGLYDMHGNVSEWTADQHADDFFERLSTMPSPVVDPIHRPVTRYPRVVRGGSWDDDPDALRSANRIPSEADWKMQDPQLPRSIWYHTDALGVGFRIVRPRTVPDVDTINAFWNSRK